jgi:hypothetical protein
MDYAYHSDMVEQDNKKKELEEAAFATISNLKFCNFRTPGFNKRKFPVNFLMLKEMCEVGGVLEDAHIFKYLFGFEVAGNCFKKQDEGFDFYEYDIRFDQWNLLLKFLKFDECKLINGEPEQLMEVCNKFGGIPAYDRWYQNINQRKKKAEDGNYNPVTPQEDTKQLYLWRACPDNRMEWFGKNNEGYSIAGHHKLGQITYTYYWRKLKTDANTNDAAPAAEPLIQNRTNYSHQEEEMVVDDMHDFREDTILENF